MNDLRTIPLSSLRLSQTQAQAERRAHFDQAKLAELAESIKTVGLLQPLVVRPAPPYIVEHNDQGPVYETEVGACEIIAGERRYLAAQLAGLVEVPCSVRQLTDEQVLEVQLVENLQREDLHELAEAEGYEALQQLGHSIDGIIERLQQPASRQIFRRLFEDRQQSPECADGRIPSDSPERLRDAEFARVVRGAQS
jgi:ParB/RepB/Spo0J family partition protein